MIRILLTIITASALTCTVVPERTMLYVSPAGDDTHDGLSRKTAFRTIGKAARTAGPGSVVNILPGTYAERIRPVQSGTETAPVIYRGTDRAGVIITTDSKDDGGEWLETAAFKVSGHSHIILENVTFRDAEAWVFIMDDAHHVTVSNCVFDGCRIYHGVYIMNASRNRIVDCDFRRGRPLADDWEETHHHANLVDYIAVWRNSHYNLIQGCTFKDVTHDCIMILGFGEQYRPTGNIVRNCTFHDIKWKGIGVHSSEHTLIENNSFKGLAAAFIQFHASRVIVRNNVFYGHEIVKTTKKDGKPFLVPDDFKGAVWLRSHLNEYGDLELARQNRIYNNVFYDNQRALTYRPKSGSPTGILPVADNVIKNNIFFRNGRNIRLPKPFYKSFSVQRGNYIRNNLVGGSPAETPFLELCEEHTDEVDAYDITGAEKALAEFSEKTQVKPDLCSGNIGGDPLFAGPAGNDFSLKNGSPAAGKGADLTVTADAGSGTGVRVADAFYFSGGFGMIAGDRVRIGENEPARICRVDYNERILKLDRAVSWRKGDAVNLAAMGRAPDMGLYNARSAAGHKGGTHE